MPPKNTSSCPSKQTKPHFFFFFFCSSRLCQLVHLIFFSPSFYRCGSKHHFSQHFLPQLLRPSAPLAIVSTRGPAGVSHLRSRLLRMTESFEGGQVSCKCRRRRMLIGPSVEHDAHEKHFTFSNVFIRSVAVARSCVAFNWRSYFAPHILSGDQKYKKQQIQMMSSNSYI